MRAAKRRRHLHSLEYFERPLLAELSRRRVSQNDPKRTARRLAGHGSLQRIPRFITVRKRRKIELLLVTNQSAVLARRGGNREENH